MNILDRWINFKKGDITLKDFIFNKEILEDIEEYKQSKNKECDLKTKICPYCKSTELLVYSPNEVKNKLGPFNCCECNEDIMKPILSETNSDITYYHYSTTSHIPDFIDYLGKINMLFLCHNKKEWYNNYPTDEHDNTLIKMESDTINDKNTYLLYTLDEYHNLFVWPENEDEHYVVYTYSDKLKELISQGYICFKLDIENSNRELTEMFVIEPTKNLRIV